MNRLAIFLLIIVVLLIGWWGYQQLQVKDGFTKIKVGDSTVTAIIRDTIEGRRRGLSGYEELEENEGMLFVFPVATKYSFWMKEMKFDLDMVWIMDDRIVEITEGVVAPVGNESPVTVQPKVKVNRVLEVNSGWVEKNGVKVGDEVKY